MIPYLVERGRPGLFVPAAVLIAFAANVGPAFDLPRIATGALLALLLIAQFRLWDDLADIERDRSRHPERVLSRTDHLDRFVLFGLVLAIANIAMSAWVVGTTSVVLLILLDATLATWYAARPHRRSLFGDLLVLVKYPVFVFILAGSSSPSPGHITAALAIYAAACVFELWHDASSPLRRRVNA